MQVKRHFAVRRHKVKGRAPARRFGVRRRPAVEQQLGNVLVAIRHGPHQRAPVVAVLPVDVGPRGNQRLHDALVAETACVDQWWRAVLVGHVEVDKWPRLALQDFADLRDVAVAGRHVKDALQGRALIVVGQLLVGRYGVLVLGNGGGVVGERGLRGQHFHEPCVAVRDRALCQVFAVVGVVEGELAEAKWFGKHRRGQELGLSWEKGGC